MKADGSSMFPPALGSVRWLNAAPLWFWTAAASFIQEVMSVVRNDDPSAVGTGVSECCTIESEAHWALPRPALDGPGGFEGLLR